MTTAPSAPLLAALMVAALVATQSCTARAEPSVSDFNPYPRQPLLQTRHTLAGQTDVGEVSQSRLLASFGVPLSTGAATLIGAAKYQLDHLRLPAAHPIGGNLELHRFEVGLPIVLRLAERWSLAMSNKLIYACDLREGFDDAAFSSFSRASLSWLPGETTALSLGVALFRWDNMLVPMPSFALVYRPAGGPISVDVSLFRKVELRWFAAERWEPYLSFFFDPGSWQVTGIGRLSLLEIRAEVGARYQLMGPLELDVSFGTIPWRRHGVTGPTGIKQELVESFALLGSTQLVYRTN